MCRRTGKNGNAKNGNAMYVLLVHYVRPLAEVDAQIEAHRGYLKKHFARGQFIVSGTREPRDVGGIILARVSDEDELRHIIAEDPFVVAGVAQYEILPFTPRWHDPRFEPFLGPPAPPDAPPGGAG